MLEKIVTVLDADLWEGREYFGRLFYNQLETAHLILLNKVDQVDEDDNSPLSKRDPRGYPRLPSRSHHSVRHRSGDTLVPCNPERGDSSSRCICSVMSLWTTMENTTNLITANIEATVSRCEPITL